MTREEICKAYGSCQTRLDGVIERTVPWIDIVCDPAKHNPSTFNYQPPFSFRYSEWRQTSANSISRYVYVTQG